MSDIDPNRDKHEQCPPEPSYDDNVLKYGEKSVKNLFLVFITVFLAGSFIVWFFLGDRLTQEDTTPPSESPSVAASQNDMSAQIEQSGQNMVYQLFKKMFSGAEQGLELSDTELNIGDSGVNDSLQAQIYLEKQSEKISEVETGYKYSLFDVIGAEVTGKTGRVVGEVEDILVNRNTGEARYLLIDDDEDKLRQDLKDIQFDKVFKQSSGGKTRIALSESGLESKDKFVYTDEERGSLISLLRLRDGLLLDYKGEIAGDVDAIIYGNAEARGLVLDLRPALEDYQSSPFYISFDQASFVESRDGLDIKLTKSQTRALAQRLFEANRPANQK